MIDGGNILLRNTNNYVPVPISFIRDWNPQKKPTWTHCSPISHATRVNKLNFIKIYCLILPTVKVYSQSFPCIIYLPCIILPYRTNGDGTVIPHIPIPTLYDDKIVFNCKKFPWRVICTKSLNRLHLCQKRGLAKKHVLVTIPRDVKSGVTVTWHLADPPILRRRCLWKICVEITRHGNFWNRELWMISGKISIE